MATTTNFGWETPDNTDLVKDGAAAIRTLGNGIDTSFLDLKGGTTGQILSKASNTDLDYTWINNDQGDITGVTAGTGISGGGTSGTVTVTNSMATAIDAKGDLIAGTGADTFDRLAVGTNGQALLADSTTATGLKWGSASSTSAFSLLGTGTLTGAQTVTVSGISGQNKIYILIKGAGSGTQPTSVNVRPNNNTTAANYVAHGIYHTTPAAYATSNHIGNDNSGTQGFQISTGSTTTSAVTQGGFFIDGCNSTNVKPVYFVGGQDTGTSKILFNFFGLFKESATISSISLWNSNGNWTTGTFEVYGSAV